MSEIVFSSSRRFLVYSYALGHGLLLLRSGKTPVESTRVDVLFQDVRAWEIRAVSEGLVVAEEPEEFLAQFSSRPTEMMQPGLKVFSIGGAGWQGYVLAGILRTQEDDGEFTDKSKLTGT